MRFVEDIARKNRSGLCAVFGCSNNRYKHRTFCPKHIRQHTKESNPIAYTFDILKQNAKRRGKVFKLTIQYFRRFCEEHDYIARKGRSSESMTIDCKIKALGYVEGNIQVMTNAANVRKEHAYRRLRERYGEGWNESYIDDGDDWNPKKVCSDEDPPF